MYYQNIDLYRSQSVVDNMVDNLAFTLGVGREDLNIVSHQPSAQCKPLTRSLGCRCKGVDIRAHRHVHAER